MRKKSAEQKLREFLASKMSSSRCYRCSYLKGNYCSDLDVRVDPDYPVCSKENYES